MNVHGFIRKEVSHQGFDLDTDEGQLRVEWMHLAWGYAQFHNADPPTPHDMLELGWLVERSKNDCGYRKVNVQVGGRVCPAWRDVPLLIKQLWGDLEDLCPLEFYLRFELIHPFEDGNGRVGKILLCWLNETLDDPDFPPDLFGGGNP